MSANTVVCINRPLTECRRVYSPYSKWIYGYRCNALRCIIYIWHCIALHCKQFALCLNRSFHSFISADVIDTGLIQVPITYATPDRQHQNKNKYTHIIAVNVCCLLSASTKHSNYSHVIVNCYFLNCL